MSFPDTLNLNYLIEELSSQYKTKSEEATSTVIETASDTVEHTNDDGKFYSVRILWLTKYSINS